MKLSILGALILFLASTADGQTYNSNSGGYNTGYGTVYGSFGLAQATQSMYNQMQIAMNQSILRAAMVKKHGAAAVEKAEAAARAGSKASIPVTPRPLPKNYGKFRPDPSVATGKTVAETLGESAEEKALIQAIVDQTKQAFDKEAAAKGWQNNLAGAFTFFIVATGTIYHDSPEPSDDTVNALYDAMNQTIDEIPEIGKLPNRDKQALYNTLVAFAALPLATFAEGKESNHKPTIETARQLAGTLIEIVLKSSPERLRFENGEIRFK